MLDEIQNLDGWERWVETLYRRGVNMVITGSNAKLLSSELSSMLSGRYLQIEILPFSLTENLRFLGIPTTNETPQERGVYMHEVDEYMHNGGYPEIISTRQLTETYLRGVYDTVLLKDIIQRYKIHKTDDLYNLAEWLVSNYTGLFTISSLAEELGMTSKTTVSKYCSYLQQSYMFFYLPRFNNKLQLMKKAPQKVYMVDNGFVKAKAFGVSPDLGKLLENMVFDELLHRGYVPGLTLFYYRSRNDKEADFVLRQGNKVEQIVQVCYDLSSPKTYKREQGALEETSEELKCKNMCVVTWDTEGEMEIDGLKAPIISFEKWAVSK
jgi:predicted AAA+ superfamily ATPase